MPSQIFNSNRRHMLVTAWLMLHVGGTLGQSLQEGVYTEAQAVRGQVLYYAHCLACHGESMMGVDQAPPLTGPQFASNWRGLPLADLVERMNTMPPDKPGTLTREELVDTLTYVLWYNGAPIGNVVLSADPAALSAQIFDIP